MTPERRLGRLERVTKMLINKGRRARSEWREQSRDQAEKINILIHMQMKLTERMERTDVQINSLAVAQAELTKSQKLTQQAFRDYLKRANGETNN